MAKEFQLMPIIYNQGHRLSDSIKGTLQLSGALVPTHNIARYPSQADDEKPVKALPMVKSLR